METLTQFINRRLAELAMDERPLREELARIETERDQLQRAALAAGVSIGAVEAGVAGSVGRSPRRAPETTIKDAVIEVLREQDKPLTALEILPLINAKLGVDYPRTSLSPQLSRLKSDGIVRRMGTRWTHRQLWTLPEGAETDEASEAQSRPDTSEASGLQPEQQGREAGPGGGA